ncbi:hypothetical protein MSAN_00861700 [Mycena sanguinolenta]|uniref:Uncharacterized protein n=1 Tax=Mycena sanguinolenta TaxID=230812 RepID=A0A8H6YVP7_9AGAR|nr:hypothetical protein MSAN_00861700 [Mycena sanguinolenta]
MTTISSELSFPPELEREIFEVTAALFPAFIPTLLRVCQRVHVWIEPLLYRVLMISSSGINSTQMLNLVDSKASILQNGVRHMYIQTFHTGGSIDTYKNLLAACSRCMNLAIDGQVEGEFVGVLDKMRPRALAFTVPEGFFAPDSRGFTHPLFLSVTHLDLYHGVGLESNWEPWSGLASLPALTHLALSHPIAGGILSRVVAECPRLSIVAVPMFAWEQEIAVDLAGNLGFSDARVAVIVLSEAYEVDWELGARGGDDFWARAQTFINLKRGGQIEASCYLLDESAIAPDSP